jgi:hypothetical protein
MDCREIHQASGHKKIALAAVAADHKFEKKKGIQAIGPGQPWPDPSPDLMALG